MSNFIGSFRTECDDACSGMRRSESRYNFASIAVFALALLSLLAGLALSAEEYAGLLADAKALDRIGLALILLGFPLFMLSAHLMDKAGDARRLLREAYCREHGLTDAEVKS